MKFEMKKHWWIIVALVAVIYFIGMKPQEQRIGGGIPIMQVQPSGGFGAVKACSDTRCTRDVDCTNPDYQLCYCSQTSAQCSCCNYK